MWATTYVRVLYNISPPRIVSLRDRVGWHVIMSEADWGARRFDISRCNSAVVEGTLTING